MAVRRPLYYDSGNLREMSGAMITAIQNRCVYVYAGNPSALLTVVSSGGNLGAMNDTRLVAGAEATRGTAGYNTAAAVDTIGETVGEGIAKISQTNATVSTPTDTNNKLYPAYYDGSGTIQAMTATDMFDTFITQAIDDLVGSHVTKQGTFTITNSATPALGHTLILGGGDNKVFEDTRADKALYEQSGVGIPETIDQSKLINSYYLHITDQEATGPSITQPLQINSGNDLQTYTLANFDAMLLAEMRHHTVNTSGSKITYSINGSGNNRGTGMDDTKLDGSFLAQRTFSADDYRAQNFPDGTPQTVTQYFLKITRSS